MGDNTSQVNLKILEAFYKSTLTNWALTRFKWEGLPEHIPPYWLEWKLLTESEVYFYLSEHTGRFELGTGSRYGMPDRYEEPLVVMIPGKYTYPSDTTTKNQFVRIRPAYFVDSTTTAIDIYASRLANVHVSLDLVTRAMRVSRIAYADDRTKLSVANILQQIDTGENFIRVNNTMDLADVIKPLDLSVDPRTLGALRDEANSIWSDFLSTMGITNVGVDKKERLVAAEAEQSSGEVSAARMGWLKPRQDACREINELFGLDVSVKWALDEEQSLARIGGVPGELHDPA